MTEPTVRLRPVREADLELLERFATDPDRALEKCGFRREGLLRQAGFRGGQWRNVAVYGRLRDDGEGSAT